METAASLNLSTVLYLYGLVEPRADLSGLAAVEEGAGIFLVQGEEVACAVSVVPAAAYEQPSPAASAAEQLDWVTPRAWRHHEVLRRLHRAGTVVPLKFGTLCASASQVELLLQRVRAPVADLLRHFRGKDEWTLKICHDVAAHTSELQLVSPELVALQEEERQSSGGRAYFVRKKLQRATADLVAACDADIQRRVLARLADLDFEMGVAEREPRHVPLLVDRSRFQVLEDALAALEVEHRSSHVTFELVGPWPPYSFTSAMELTS